MSAKTDPRSRGLARSCREQKSYPCCQAAQFSLTVPAAGVGRVTGTAPRRTRARGVARDGPDLRRTSAVGPERAGVVSQLLAWRGEVGRVSLPCHADAQYPSEREGGPSKVKEQRRQHFQRLRLTTSVPQSIPWSLPETIDFRRTPESREYDKPVFLTRSRVAPRLPCFGGCSHLSESQPGGS